MRQPRIGLLACLACENEPRERTAVDDTLQRCHPHAGRSLEPASSLRSSTPPADVVAWVPPPAPPSEGPLAPNNALEGAQRLGEAELHHPEDVAFDSDGRIYTGTEDGTIWRAGLSQDAQVAPFEPFAHVEGPALGLDFDPCGNVVVAVKNRGLVAIDPQGRALMLADRVNGTLIEFADELAIARDGTIYFSEASTKYDHAWPYEALEGRPHGRLLAYEPTTGEVRVLLDDDLYFPNGVIVAEDESYLLFVESLRGRLRRYELSGPGAGTTVSVNENLPLAADNISRDERGRLWLAGERRTPEIEQLSALAETRLALLQNSFEQLLAMAPGVPYGLVVVLDERGAPVQSLHDGSGRMEVLSSAVPRGDFLYLGTARGRGLARVSLAAVSGP